MFELYTWCRLAAQIFILYLWFGKTAIFYTKSLQLLRNNNILFTKIFQSLANSNTVQVDPDLRIHLQKYTANTSYTESEINYELLDKIEAEHQLQIDRRVINSGMIALVFKGTDASGKQIVVKLRRRDIIKQLEKGCASVKVAYMWANYFFPNNIYVRILRPFIININDIIEQCRFSKEIVNLRKAKDDFAELDFIQIPTVYNTETPDAEYILMDFIEGSHTLPATTTEEERAEYMEKFGTFTTYAFLCNAVQHTDLHSGNIIFTKEGFGIIDYGMAVQPSEEVHDITLAIAMIMKDRPQLHEVDFICTFKDVFDPPLIKEDIPADVLREAEDICIAITQPLIEAMDLDELNITDNLSRLSVCLKREIILNRTIYKIILGFSMMGAKNIIMGDNYPNEKLIKIEKRALRRAFALIM
jgi:tRNA A-37 threonylcarbamoyl transferase component Bud32